MRRPNWTNRKLGKQAALALVGVGATAMAFAGCSGNGGGGRASAAAAVTSGTTGGVGSGSSGAVTSGARTELTGIDIAPPGDLVLELGLGAGFQVIVDGYYRDAAVRDLTRDVTFTVADPGVVQVTGEGLIQPLTAGSTEVSVSVRSHAGQDLTVTKKVTVLPAPAQPAQPNFVALAVYPPFRTLVDVDSARGRDQLQQVVVVATDDQGRLHDLTRTIGIRVQDMNRNASVAGTVTPTGLFRGVIDGQEAVLAARLDAFALVEGSHLVLGSGRARPLPTGALYSGAPLAGSSNELDRAVLRALQGQLIEPARLSSDGEFLRRLHADALGRLPSEAELAAFLAATAADKRAREIDRVLATPEFAAHWGDRFGEWFEIGRSYRAFDTWAADRIAQNATLADMVTELATGQGPAGAIFDQAHPEPADKVDVLVLAGAGMTAECAKCHDHPLTGPNDDPRWTQDERYGLDAFFARTPTDATKLNKTGNRFGQPLQPGFVFDPAAAVNVTLSDSLAQRRAAFARLFTASAAFKRGLGHRIFADVAVPLLDPNEFLRRNIDGVTVPALLDAITSTMDAQNTSLKGFLRGVFGSKLYQLTSEGKDTTHDRLMARHTIRRHQAEVFERGLEALLGAGVTGMDQRFLRQSFGFPLDRDDVHARKTAVNMGQALVLFNSPVVQARLAADTGLVARLAADVSAGTVTTEAAVTRIWRIALSRDPAPDELTAALDAVNAAPNARQGLEDVAAAVVATIEFGTR